MRATPRQRTIVSLAAEGLADKQIAGRLGLSVNTVRTHLERLFRENHFNNRAEAVGAWASQEAELAQAPAGEAAPGPPAGARQQAGRWRRPRFSVLTMAAALLVAALAFISGGRPSNLTAQRAEAPADVSSATRGVATAPDAAPAPTEAPPAAPAAAAPASQAQPAANPQPAPVVPQLPTAFTRLPEPAQLVLVNADRAGAGLPPLTWSQCLAGVAADAARQLATQGALGSLSPTAGASTCSPGSPGNAISGYWPSVNDAAINSLFMSAPAQKAVILGNYHQFGAAWATGATGVAYAVFEFI